MVNIKLPVNNPINNSDEQNLLEPVDSFELKPVKSKKKLNTSRPSESNIQNPTPKIQDIKDELIKSIDSKFKSHINHNTTTDFVKFQESVKLMVLMNQSLDVYIQYRNLETYLSTYSLESIFDKLIYDLKSEFVSLTKSEIICKFSNYFYYSRNNLNILSTTFLSDLSFFNKCDQLIHTVYREQLLL